MKPIRFLPQYKSVIWGGTEIASFKGEPTSNLDNIGESWEISGLEGHESVVCGGEFDGMTIKDLISRFGARIIGSRLHSVHGSRFPLILKIIDAHSDLSVQVHPDDKIARTINLPNGKSEMWYILRSLPGAKIYSGFNRQMDHATLRTHVEGEQLMSSINAIETHPGDVFYLPAGRVHAVGAGNLIVEIQQASDVTYRLYDYGRRDRQGNTRQLHIDEAIRSIDYTPSLGQPVASGSHTADGDPILTDCKHFIAVETTIDGIRSLSSPRDSFMLLFAVSGKITVTTTDGDFSETLKPGHTILIPAEINRINLSGKGKLLVFSA